MFSFILIAFSTAVAVIWSLPFIVAPMFKWQLFKITERTMIIFIQKKINPTSTIISDDKPTGFICGKWFIGYLLESVSERGNSSEILYILCSNAFYKNLTSNKTGASNNDSKQLTIYERYGNFFNLQYRKRMLDIDAIKPTIKQNAIMEKIITFYGKNNHAVAFVHGKAGCGKSMLAMMTASILDGTFCQTFNPTQPGDNLSELFHSVEPTKKRPLIILLDEVDIILDAVINTITPHKYIPIAITNKIGWSMFFDNIDKRLYNNVIVIMTSNRTPDSYNDRDEAFLRKGRVDIIEELA